MNAAKTIDLKGLEHSEREKLIFPNIQELKVGENLRLILEFNPLPLVYMLKAQNEFEVVYEKEGPPEWILIIKRVNLKEDDNKERFKELLQELKAGEISDKTKEKAKNFFQKVDLKTLGLVEQELIREGVSHEEIRGSLCDIHLDFLKDTLVSKKQEAPPNHPLHTFMEEHKIILDNLNELVCIIEKLKNKDSFEEINEDLEKLKDISHHLVEAENHHQREEEVLFPKLESHGIVEPPQIMKLDHIEFKKRKQELYKFAHKSKEYNFKEFKKNVIELGEYLAKELASHIFKEDNILYQIALQVLSKEEWEEVKKTCDKIGYCCFTPIDKLENEEIVELDLRILPAFERHDKIFQNWDNLKSGQILKIINDHDPKPLHYQFEAEYKDKYEWEYIQKGPKDWVVKIKKL
ncbi:MAG: DUF438 domain-containing protein [Armatimonadetes bacterium]|nr:DUF438 domain-containing protein [Armatimonadota bacterium]